MNNKLTSIKGHRGKYSIGKNAKEERIYLKLEPSGGWNIKSIMSILYYTHFFNSLAPCYLIPNFVVQFSKWEC